MHDATYDDELRLSGSEAALRHKVQGIRHHILCRDLESLHTMCAESIGHFEACNTEIYTHIACVHGRLHPHAPVRVLLCMAIGLHSWNDHYDFVNTASCTCSTAVAIVVSW